MKNIHLIILLSTAMVSLIFVSCDSSKKQDKKSDAIMVDSYAVKLGKATDTVPLSKINAGESKAKLSPIHGQLSPTSLSQYYPNISDTIKQIANMFSERLDINPGDGISVSLLHNTAVSDQKFLCTHDKNLILLDRLYIGKSTDFDDGKSHTIETKIISNSEIVFDQIDWGYIKKGNEEEEIDTVKHEKWVVRIDKNGMIKNKIIVHKKMPYN
ncbi:MAG: hypothetical protein ACOH1O_06295 [Flavobacterium sp.]